MNLRAEPRKPPTDPDPESTVQVARRRFARRRLARRLAALRPLLIALGLVGLVGGLAWLFFFSSVLAYDGIKVTGTDYVRDARIRALATPQLGEPLARVDVDAIAARIEDLAPVESVEVSRCWPHEICVDVTERQAVAAVEKEGRFWGLDHAGILFRPYAERPTDLPLVKVRATSSTDALTEAASVVAALPPTVTRRVAYLDVETVDAISLTLRNGAVVVWGSADDSANKVRVLEPLLKAQPRAARYNVSAPGSPTATLP